MGDLYLIRGYYFETSFEGAFFNSKGCLEGRFLDDSGPSTVQGILKKRKLKIILEYENNPEKYELDFKLNKKKSQGKGKYIFPNGDKSKAFCILLKIPSDFESFIDLPNLYPNSLEVDTTDLEN